MPLTAEQKAYLHHDGAIDPRARLLEMDLMGIDQVLVIPTMVIMHVPFATNAEGVAAFCEAYNNFVVDWCSEESEPALRRRVPARPRRRGTRSRRSTARPGSGCPVGLIRPIDAQAKYPNAAAPSMMANGDVRRGVQARSRRPGWCSGCTPSRRPTIAHPLGVDYPGVSR